MTIMAIKPYSHSTYTVVTLYIITLCSELERKSDSFKQATTNYDSGFLSSRVFDCV